MEQTELVEAARSVAPTLLAHADAADRTGRLPGETVTALRAAGMFRLGVPLAFGGHEADPLTGLEVIAELGLSCPSSAWVVMLSYVAQQMAASFGEQARSDMWEEGGDAPMCGVFGGSGVASAVDGGIVASGSWPWASGCLHADWALVGVALERDGGRPGRALALVPCGHMAVEETWDMVGMRGTGSHTLLARDVFVPEHRIRSFADAFAGTGTSPEPLYRVPPGSMVLTSMAPLLGAARAILGLTREAVDGGKPMAMSLHARLADSPSVQAALADAATLIDSAALHLERSARAVVAAAEAGTTTGLLERARVRMDVGHASTCLRQAVQGLMTVGGASGFARSRAVQRYWRDLETGARHPSLNPDLAREMYGRALVGDTRPVSPMV